ncbi:MAG: 2'-5' RNA ligase family protein [Bacteroidetes bacterium]|nr:2'-5' RNA ligase family protein [Bacteroidota bacterium]
MVSNLVLAFPKLENDTYEWIQSIRKSNDIRYYTVVKPHFTIVFPLFNYEIGELQMHIKNICTEIESIQFSIRATTIVKDSFSEYTDVFLVPDEGNSQIIKLHNKLYTGIIRKELRLDIPFIPHIGIGASKVAEDAKQLSNNLNKQKFCVESKITELDLVEYSYPKVNLISKYLLK